ncbi:28S ribosomal protein S17 mitochondrial [Biomphalaria glabrata]|uniref:28S ribosomal protein S17, mitochondrial-like n=2 Tax=Biomphalaria TaxID=6525 RepID=A0A2C9LL68_BIOGL|nr:28S ribosomal protein S17, mitochondrial-like [Biomphalaria glabrata]KAI8759621.1 28S ribosomal protein S17, mitochondrial [Biomphalaria glabrata]KAI8762263.1 28S ribosomal protein S17; mitochondrial-like [Biomphalaria glabrata]KAK0061778.1 28S ribosomal protein S17 mitochondrial [Biomphalaria pfeifferi]
MTSIAVMLGQVLHREVLKPRIVNVRVIQQVYDQRLHMFFPEPKDFKVFEDKVKVNHGDIVKIEQLPEKLSVEVEHEIVEVVFPMGRTVDPLTGKRCRGMKFIDEDSRKEESKRVAEMKEWKDYPL